jgi:hypothetical protein
MVGYGRHSETERMPVNNDSLTNWSLLKIQSSLIRNNRDNRLTKPYNADFDGDRHM